MKVVEHERTVWAGEKYHCFGFSKWLLSMETRPRLGEGETVVNVPSDALTGASAKVGGADLRSIFFFRYRLYCGLYTDCRELAS